MALPAPVVRAAKQKGTQPTPLLITDFAKGVTATVVGSVGVSAGKVFTSGDWLVVDGAGSFISWQLGSPNYHARFVVPRRVTNGGGIGWQVRFRFQDPSNYWYISEASLSGTYFYGKVINGVDTFIGVVPGGNPGVVNGNTISIDCTGDTITVGIKLASPSSTLSTSTWQTDPALRTGTGIAIGTTQANQVPVGISDIVAWATPIARPAEWHVHPTAKANGAGTIGQPFQIDVALSGVEPCSDGRPLLGRLGESILMHENGQGYGHSLDPILYITIGEAGANPCCIEPYFNGEDRPRVYRQLQRLTGQGQNVSWYHILFPGDDPARTTNYKGIQLRNVGLGIDLHGVNDRFNYCVLSNRSGAWGYWEQATGSVIFMCITYNCGFRDITNLLPAVQGFYNQVDNNAVPGTYQQIDTCITCFQYQTGIQVYGSGATHLDGGIWRNNVWFYGGFLGASYAQGQAIHEILIGSTSINVHVDDCYFDNNWIWGWPLSYATVPQYSQFVFRAGMQLGYNGKDNTFVSWTNNVCCCICGIQYFRNVECYGNVFAQPTFNVYCSYIQYDAPIGALPVQAGLGWDYNTYYASNDGDTANHGKLIWNDGISNHSFDTIPNWFASTGYDQHSQVLPYGKNIPVMAKAYINTHEPTALYPTPRAFIYVFDIGDTRPNTVTVSVAGMLNQGNLFAIYDWGQWDQKSPSPILTGIYDGSGSITIPLKPQKVPTILANDDPVAYHDTLPEYLPAGQPGVYIMTVHALRGGS